MLDPRWRKLARDAWMHRGRSALVVLAMGLGLAGSGVVLNAWALVQRATVQGYGASLPVSATLVLDRVDDALLREVRALPAIAAARARRSVNLVAESGATRLNALVVALQDPLADDIARIAPEAGNWPPRDGELVIERSSLEFSGAVLGEPLTLRTRAGNSLAAPVRGIVRDVSLAPGWMEHVVYGYASSATLQSLGLASGYDELQIRVRDTVADRAAVRRVAHTVRELAEARGYRVDRVDVPEPGQHVHAAQMDSLLMTQGAFGLLALLACAFLMVNLIQATLAGQVREIGVMKTLGARPRDLAAMYLTFAAALGALALAGSLPVSLWLGRRYGALKADLLNFPLDGVATPAWAPLLQVVVGVALPVLAAWLPVRAACRRSVADALRDFGLAPLAPRALGLRRLLPAGAARPLLLSLHNAFRQRQRLVLTLLALALGGAVYVGALNLRTAVVGSIDLLYASQRFDLSLRLEQPRAPAEIEPVAAAVEGVAASEAWSGVRATLLDADGVPGDGFALTGVPPHSALLAPRLIAGRWLREDAADQIVVNRSLLRDTPGLAPGAKLRVQFEGREVELELAGIVDTGIARTAYMARDALSAWRGHDRAGVLVVRAALRSEAAQLDLIQRLRTELELAGSPVASSQRLAETRRVTEDHLLMVVQFLGAMAWVMIAVGGMGLASTLGLSVLERTREIGVLRAIGAGHREILAMVLAEGGAIALLAFLLALPLSVPMSVLLGIAFGRVMFEVPLHLAPDLRAVLVWLLLVAVVTLLACIAPAMRALRVPVARALACT